ncbi:zinc finger, CCHC-type containing protein [Tanacetum coccineum]
MISRPTEDFKNYKAYDMIQELKTMFEEQAKQELFEIVKAFHACKQEEGQSLSSYLLKMKSYLDTLECLGYAMPNELGVPVVLAIREGKIQKDKKKKPQGAKGKTKGKNKLAYAPKTKISPPPKRDNMTKDFICHHCKEVGHWRRNCPSYHAELKKRKNASMASTSSIFTIELYDFPNKTWVYDTGYGTRIFNTSQGLRESMNLKHRALSLYMGNGIRATVEAIRSFYLILPRGLIIVKYKHASSTNKAFENPEYSPNLESSLNHLHKILTPASVVFRPNSCFHARIELEKLEVFNHVIQLIKNPSLSHHLLLIISIFIDYLPRLADYGVIFFEQKFRCIPIRLSDIEFRVITFNPELQIFYKFSDDDVPYLQVDCVEEMNFVGTR